MSLRKHVVIIGGGFGGLAAAKSLAHAPVRITLIDRNNHHLFQPLLYQVAMAGLSPAEIAAPIRSVLSKQTNATILLDEATAVDLDAHTITLREGAALSYDFLIVATGARTNYFGHDEWARYAPGLKDLDDAVEIRRRVLLAFEEAEREPDEAKRRTLLTFVVIGGGPTGVELAGAIAELADYVLARDFRRIHPDLAKVILLEGGPHILPAFDVKLSVAAKRSLEEMGVEVRTGALVTNIDASGVALGDTLIAARTVLWAAGVAAESFTQKLGAPLDKSGRVNVLGDCSLPDHPDAFVVGDAACFIPEGTGKPLPGVSPTALQQGRFVAEQIKRVLKSKPRRRFIYLDKGIMATIGRKRAVAQTAGLRFSGFLAWLTWLFVHIYYLIDFRNRLAVLFQWTWSYMTYKRGARLITGQRRRAGAPD